MSTFEELYALVTAALERILAAELEGPRLCAADTAGGEPAQPAQLLHVLRTTEGDVAAWSDADSDSDHEREVQGADRAWDTGLVDDPEDESESEVEAEEAEEEAAWERLEQRLVLPARLYNL